MQCKDNTLKMPQLVKILLMLSITSKSIPKVRCVHMGPGFTELWPTSQSAHSLKAARGQNVPDRASRSPDTGAALSLCSRGGDEGGYGQRLMGRGLSHKHETYTHMVTS